MKAKSKRSVKNTERIGKDHPLKEETMEPEHSEMEDRVQRLRRTFHCSFTKPGGNRERWLIM